jgi:SdrD B-like domain
LSAAPSSAAVVASITVSGGGFTTKTGVFRDFDADGLWDVNEPGQGGIGVSAICVADNGTNAASSVDDTYAATAVTTTAADGSYSLVTVGSPCRVEFSIPATMAFLQPGAAGGSFVQFISASAAVTASVNNPAEYSTASSSPNLISGVLAVHANDPVPALTSVPFSAGATTLGYDGVQVLSASTPLAIAPAPALPAYMGSTWGIATQTSTKDIFTSAVLRRHGELGGESGDDIDAIYVRRAGAAAAQRLTNSIDAGTVDTNTARGFSTPGNTADPTTAMQVGVVGWGDIDMSEDDKTIYAVNLFDRTLYSLDPSNGALQTASAIPTPVGGCTGGQARPWGLGVHDGLVYANVLCDASTSQLAADLVAHVYATTAVSLAAGAPAWTDVLTIANLGTVNHNHVGGGPRVYRPWTTSVWINGAGVPAKRPMMTDLSFDSDGSLVLSLADRLGFQIALGAKAPDGSTNEFSPPGPTDTAGEIIRAAPNAAGVNAATLSSLSGAAFVVESAGSVAAGASVGAGTLSATPTDDTYGYQTDTLRFGQPTRPTAQSVPNFYWASGTTVTNDHHATTEGAAAIVPGVPQLATVLFDPVDWPCADTSIASCPASVPSTAYVRSGGIRWLSNTNGNALRGTVLFDADATTAVPTTGTFGKSQGMKDLEYLAELAPVDVGNRVWRDDNRNGVQDPGEPGLSGVAVDLTDAAGATISSVITGTSGDYLFSARPDPSVVANNNGNDVAAVGRTWAAYGVPALDPSAAGTALKVAIRNSAGASKQVVLSSFTLTESDDTVANATNVAGSDASDSDGLPGSGAFANAAVASFVLASAGLNNHTLDFGFLPSYSLGNRVWADNGVGAGGIVNDGVLNGTEAGLDGVVVRLLDSSGVAVPGVADQITANGGYYRFDDVPEGSYIVAVLSTNFSGAGVLAGYTSSGTNSVSDGVDQNDNGVGVTPDPVDGILSNIVVLGPPASSEPTGETDLSPSDASQLDGRTDITVDFGFVQFLSLGDIVWFDANHNGVQDGAETGLNGVSVELLDSAGSLIPGETTVTATIGGRDGSYRFLALQAGDYKVRFTLPTGYRWTTALADPDTAKDSNPTFTSDSDTTITTGLISLSASVTDTQGNPLSLTDPTVDAGVYQPLAALGDLVWEDLNLDGLYSPGEPPVAGAVVTVFDAAGHVAGTATTGSDGLWKVDNLSPGSYTARFESPAGMMLTGSLSGDTSADSNPNTTTGLTAAVALISGEYNPTIDAGVVKAARLDGNVYVDLDNSKTLTAGDTPIAGVAVRLVGTTAFGEVIGRETTTDAQGHYSFDLLAPGTYNVVEEQPTSYNSVAQNPGSLGGDGTVENNIRQVALKPGQQALANNFGEQRAVLPKTGGDVLASLRLALLLVLLGGVTRIRRGTRPA